MEVNSCCWNITGQCNLNCKFCVRVVSEELPLELNKKVALNLINNGVDKITFSGGEPLLYGDLFYLVDYIRKIKPDIILSLTTNAQLLHNCCDSVIKYFDWITISIDTLSEELNEKIGRGRKYLDKVFIALECFDNKGIKIKINTVAMKVNKSTIIEMLDLISKYKVKRWNIIMFYDGLYKAKENKDEYNITMSEFEEVRQMISGHEMDADVSFTNNIEFPTSYFRVYPDGAVRNENQDIVGNMLCDNLPNILNSGKINLYNHHLRRKYKEFR